MSKEFKVRHGLISEGPFILSGTLRIGKDSAVSLLSSSGDGNLTLTNAAGSQGIILDTVTTNARLFITDEAGGNASVRADGGFNMATNSSLTSATLRLNSTTGTVYNSSASRTLRIYTKGHGGSSITGLLDLYTGNQASVGNYNSGPINLHTGTTSTTGSSGDIIIYTGVAGAGSQDAGDVRLGVHGDNANLLIEGATGNTILSSELIVSGSIIGPSHLILSSSAGSNMVMSGTMGTQAWSTATVNTGSYQAGQMAYVTDGDGGSPCLAMWTGTDWLRITLGAAIDSTT